MGKDNEKRIRSANYTNAEKNLLLNLVFRYKSIIESKKTDAVTWREKEQTWRKITDAFNTNSTTGIYRNTASLRKAYDNIKKCTRKEAADEKASIIRTGGGTCEVNKDPNKELALEIINKKTIHGLNNIYDSDRQNCTTITSCTPLELSESYDENMQENVLVQEDDQDEDVPIIFEVVESEGNENFEVDWGNYKPDDLKKPVNPRLLPKAKPNEETPKITCTSPSRPANEPSSSRWTRRNRPILSSLPSSELSKKYTQLADLKIELTQMELTKLQSKTERDAAEWNLRKKALELDIKIKQAYLEKIESPAFNPLKLPRI